jgi:hypothetical protein
MPERDIRKTLKDRIEAWGGEQRAVAWLGRRNAPDVLALFDAHSLYALRFADDAIELHPLIETKAPGGKPTDAQAREHGRLRRAGFIVKVISTIEQLDAWLPPR